MQLLIGEGVQVVQRTSMGFGPPSEGFFQLKVSTQTKIHNSRNLFQQLATQSVLMVALVSSTIYVNARRTSEARSVNIQLTAVHWKILNSMEALSVLDQLQS